LAGSPITMGPPSPAGEAMAVDGDETIGAMAVTNGVVIMVDITVRAALGAAIPEALVGTGISSKNGRL
jgi:hypothetical protein